MAARILVIEDNPANLELMTYLLRAYKYEPLSASDGEAGLALARKERPEVVICDIQLPGIDGYEVSRRLKADPAMRSIPIIAVTAFAMVGDRDRALSAGFDGYIGKPIVPETFVSQVEQFLKTRNLRAPAPPDDTQPASWPQQAARAGARILAVDNSPANRDFMTGALAPFGYDVVCVPNVSGALDSARARTPDLIISDIHMPGATGYDLLAQVKADPALRDVPFIFSSMSDALEDEILERLNVEADLVLLGPTEPQVLLRHVAELLAARKANGNDPRG